MKTWSLTNPQRIKHQVVLSLVIWQDMWCTVIHLRSIVQGIVRIRMDHYMYCCLWDVQLHTSLSYGIPRASLKFLANALDIVVRNFTLGMFACCGQNTSRFPEMPKPFHYWHVRTSVGTASLGLRLYWRRNRRWTRIGDLCSVCDITQNCGVHMLTRKFNKNSPMKWSAHARDVWLLKLTTTMD